MLNTLADALHPGRRSIDQISENLRALNTDIAAARAAYSEACLDVVEGKPEAEKRKQRVEAERDRIQKRCDELQAALALAHERERQKADEAAAAERAAYWQKVVQSAESRHAAVQRLGKSMATFAADYIGVLKLNEELKVMLPPDHDSGAVMTDRIVLETAMRKELCRLGLSWCFSWPWGAVSLPEFIGQFNGALDVIRGCAAQAKD
jgi:hypothetical protein